MFRGDARHSGVFETTGVEARPGVLWRFDTRGAVRSSPVVSAGRVYIGSTDGGLYALDAETGTLEWQADVGSPVSSSAAVAGGLVAGYREAFALLAGREPPRVYHSHDATREVYRLQRRLARAV